MSAPSAAADRGVPRSACRPRSGAGPAYECGWCGRPFREDRGQPACRSCPLTRLCGRVRCPHCGWENPARPGRGRRAAGPDAKPGRSWWRRLIDRILPNRRGAE